MKQIAVLAVRLTAAFLGFSLVPAMALALGPIQHEVGPGSTGADVTALQEFLVQEPSLYPSGQITGSYDTNTQQAVEKYQCEHNIVCSGTAQTTGYGQVGPETLAAINNDLAHLPLTPTLISTSSPATLPQNTSTTTGTGQTSINQGTYPATTTATTTSTLNTGASTSGGSTNTSPNGNASAPYGTTANVSGANTTAYGQTAPNLSISFENPNGIFSATGTIPSATSATGADVYAPIASPATAIVTSTSASGKTTIDIYVENSKTSSTTATSSSATNMPLLGVGSTTPSTNTSSSTAIYNGTMSSPSTTTIPTSTAAGTTSLVTTLPYGAFATIVWTTSEPSYSTVMYSTQWPFVYATAPTIAWSNLETRHIISIPNLLPHTRYYYVRRSMDKNGNITLSGPYSFMTQ